MLLQLREEEGHRWLVLAALHPAARITFMGNDAAQRYYSRFNVLIVNCCEVGECAREGTDDGHDVDDDSDDSDSPFGQAVQLGLNESSHVQALQNAMLRVVPTAREALSKGSTVVVHCNQGLIRSPSVCVLLLQALLSLQFHQATRWIHAISADVSLMPAVTRRNMAHILKGLPPPRAERASMLLEEGDEEGEADAGEGWGLEEYEGKLEDQPEDRQK
eukprot:m.62644 g.62644  ORF g.62644 m.62644 type:complete len:218 (+) comp11917_c2_seq3:125-778(+)